MKTATVRDLRNHYTGLLDWIEAGEQIVITRRGKPIARLIPESGSDESQVSWKNSASIQRKRNAAALLSETDKSSLLEESRGQW